MSDQPVTRPLPTQNSTIQKNMGKHTCLKQDSNPRFCVYMLNTHAPDCTAAVIGSCALYSNKIDKS
jgi:hypothetical protein